VTQTPIPIPFLDRLHESAPVQRLLDTIPIAGKPTLVRGLAGSLSGMLAAMHFAKHRLQTVIVCGDPDTASDVLNDAP